MPGSASSSACITHASIHSHVCCSAAHTIKFTSHFSLSSAEIDLLVDILDGVCKDYAASA